MGHERDCQRGLRDTYLEYFGTYLGYLLTNPTSQHSDTSPANSSWIPDIPRHHLLWNQYRFFLETLRISHAFGLLFVLQIKKNGYRNCTCLNCINITFRLEKSSLNFFLLNHYNLKLSPTSYSIRGGPNTYNASLNYFRKITRFLCAKEVTLLLLFYGSATKVASQQILELITQEYLHLQDLLRESSQQLNNHQKLSP
jgi:hypothetical protein